MNVCSQKLWAVCDLAMSVIWARSQNFELREFPSDARIPRMYFAPQSEYFVNTRVFLPPELQVTYYYCTCDVLAVYVFILLSMTRENPLLDYEGS